MENIADQLTAHANLFADFSAEDIAILAPTVRRKSLGKGEVLCRAGERSSSLYIISHGSVEVRQSVADTEFTLATLLRGEACGEIALVSGNVRTADLVAAEDSAVLEISREELDRALAAHPEVAAKLWHNLALALATRLASTDEILARMIEHRRKRRA